MTTCLDYLPQLNIEIQQNVNYNIVKYEKQPVSVKLDKIQPNLIINPQIILDKKNKLKNISEELKNKSEELKNKKIIKPKIEDDLDQQKKLLKNIKNHV